MPKNEGFKENQGTLVLYISVQRYRDLDKKSGFWNGDSDPGS